MSYTTATFILAGVTAGFASYLPLKRIFDNRLRRMRIGDEKGITLQPGESAQLEFDVPPEIQAALEERELVVFVDGERKGCFRLRWKPAPPN